MWRNSAATGKDPAVAHATIAPKLDIEKEYQFLQERLNRKVTGAPDSAATRRILRLLFTPEDAHIAGQLPQLISLPGPAEKLVVDVDDLNEQITSMARRDPVPWVHRRRVCHLPHRPVPRPGHH
jgi:hypothetical protein